jgi:hypothetical protein
MTDSRTPFEIASGLDGRDLADYRDYKVRFHRNDPPFWICPECKLPVVGDAQDQPCLACRTAKRDAEVKAEKDAESRRRDSNTTAGGLADKVKEAGRARQEQGDVPERRGAECACPDD